MTEPIVVAHCRVRTTAISLALLAGVIVCGAWVNRQQARANVTSALVPNDTCLLLELVLPTADSMVATVPHADCGAVRLVVTAPPQRVSMGRIYSMERAFRIPVALENAGRRTLRTPLAMRVDSATPVQRGRQLAAFYAHGLFDIALWLQPWRFSTSDTSGLHRGERSRPDTLVVATSPFTQAVRLWLNVDDARPTQPYQPGAGSTPTDEGPPGRAIEQFVSLAHPRRGIPQARTTRVVFSVPKQGLVIFETVFREPRECHSLSGCAWLPVPGLEYRGRIGWLRTDGLDSTASLFRLAPTDTFLFSVALHDTLEARFGAGNDPDVVLSSVLLQQPYVPRALLMRYADELYIRLNGASLELARSPAVSKHPDVLTLLANLACTTSSCMVQETARATLRRIAPDIVSDSTTSARTLFLIAQMRPDSALEAAIMAHPNARSNTAILSVIACQTPWARARAIQSLHASDRVRGLVARFFQRSLPNNGRELLDDAEAGANQDVLLVLANCGSDQEVGFAATRRLPESSLRMLEPDYVPQP